MEEILLRLNAVQEENRVLHDSNMKLNAHVQAILEENRLHRATVEELEVSVHALEARVEYMEAITSKDSMCYVSNHLECKRST